MQLTLNLTIPKDWQELSDKQLRHVYRLLAGNYSLPQIKSLCLMKWAGLDVLRREGSVYIVKHRGESYPLTALQITEATTCMTWLDGVPGYPVRLSRLRCQKLRSSLPNGEGGGRGFPVRADFQDVSFGDFLILDNLYQGYLQTKRADLLAEMAKTMYRAKKITLDREEEICIFYWFASVKQMFAGMFRHFLKPVSTDEGLGGSPSFQQLQESMNAQLRALTGGDITKEKQVLEMDCWRALTELDAKAKDYEDIKATTR